LRRRAYDRFTRKHREAGKAAYLAESEAEDVKPSVEVYFVGQEKSDAATAERLGIREAAKVLVRPPRNAALRRRHVQRCARHAARRSSPAQ
jgi:GntR family transcriptional regulator